MYESVACCDECWWGEDSESDELQPNGRGITPKGSPRWPMRFRQEARYEEFCHFCGWTTYSGIYVRVNTLEEIAAPLRIRKERT